MYINEILIQPIFTFPMYLMIIIITIVHLTNYHTIWVQFHSGVDICPQLVNSPIGLVKNYNSGYEIPNLVL